MEIVVPHTVPINKTHQQLPFLWPWPLSLQFEAQQTQLHTIALNIFHGLQVLTSVIIVLSIILFCSSLN